MAISLVFVLGSETLIHSLLPRLQDLKIPRLQDFKIPRFQDFRILRVSSGLFFIGIYKRQVSLPLSIMRTKQTNYYYKAWNKSSTYVKNTSSADIAATQNR